MKKPTAHITTHNHAPAPYHKLDQLALARAADCDDTDNPVQPWRNDELNALRSDNEKLQEQLIRTEKQADLDRRAAVAHQLNLEYMLHKTQAERTAAVLLLVMFVAVVLGVAL